MVRLERNRVTPPHLLPPHTTHHHPLPPTPLHHHLPCSSKTCKLHATPPPASSTSVLPHIIAAKPPPAPSCIEDVFILSRCRLMNPPSRLSSSPLAFQFSSIYYKRIYSEKERCKEGLKKAAGLCCCYAKKRYICARFWFYIQVSRRSSRLLLLPGRRRHCCCCCSPPGSRRQKAHVSLFVYSGEP